MGRTLARKIWDAHVVRSAEGEPDLLYIDLHLVHEVTSPQAFDGLRTAARTVRRCPASLAALGHNLKEAQRAPAEQKAAVLEQLDRAPVSSTDARRAADSQNQATMYTARYLRRPLFPA